MYSEKRFETKTVGNSKGAEEGRVGPERNCPPKIEFKMEVMPHNVRLCRGQVKVPFTGAFSVALGEVLPARSGLGSE